MRTIVSLVVLIVLAIVLYFIFKHGGKRSSISHDNWQRLLSICLGDEKLAQRLLESEKRQNPDLNDEEACHKAIMSYRRDNR